MKIILDQKKKCTFNCFQKNNNDSNLDDEKKKNLLHGCDNVIPPMIDTIITASKGDLKLNININQIKSCLTCFQKKR